MKLPSKFQIGDKVWDVITKTERKVTTVTFNKKETWYEISGDIALPLRSERELKSVPKTFYCNLYTFASGLESAGSLFESEKDALRAQARYFSNYSSAPAARVVELIEQVR